MVVSSKDLRFFDCIVIQEMFKVATGVFQIVCSFNQVVRTWFSSIQVCTIIRLPGSVVRIYSRFGRYSKLTSTKLLQRSIPRFSSLWISEMTSFVQ